MNGEPMGNMQRTPLYEAESDLHAAFGEVDGWEMPRVFENIKAEYLAGKGTVGVADRSHFGRLKICGANAASSTGSSSTPMTITT
jgi:glycine cleavage system aminomethyltransferase T